MLYDFQDMWPDDDIVERMFDVWQEELPLYHAGSQLAAYERYADRYNAYQDTKNNPYIFIERTYAISAEAQQLLDKNDI
jgi:hypothetical protein